LLDAELRLKVLQGQYEAGAAATAANKAWAMGVAAERKRVALGMGLVDPSSHHGVDMTWYLLRTLATVMWALGPIFLLLAFGAVLAQSFITMLLLYQVILVIQGRTTIEGLQGCADYHWGPVAKNIRAVMGPSVYMWFLPVSVPPAEYLEEYQRIGEA
jgi:hypothetical protein